MPLIRIAGYSLANRVGTKADRHLTEWCQVWARRHDWLTGFDGNG